MASAFLDGAPQACSADPWYVPVGVGWRWPEFSSVLPNLPDTARFRSSPRCCSWSGRHRRCWCEGRHRDALNFQWMNAAEFGDLIKTQRGVVNQPYRCSLGINGRSMNLSFIIGNRFGFAPSFLRKPGLAPHVRSRLRGTHLACDVNIRPSDPKNKGTKQKGTWNAPGPLNMLLRFA